MKIKTINLYSFDELTPEAQNKAIENLSNINTDYDWWDSTYEDFARLASYLGVSVDLKKTWFTLNYGQGDGSSYTASVDVFKLLECIKTQGWKEYAPKEEFHFPKWGVNVDRVVNFMRKGIIDANATIYPVNRETGVNIDTEFNYSNSRRLENIEFALGELDSIIQYAARALNGFLYRQLRAECDYLSSREAIIETIQANEYTFTENGKLENL